MSSIPLLKEQHEQAAAIIKRVSPILRESIDVTLTMNRHMWVTSTILSLILLVGSVNMASLFMGSISSFTAPVGITIGMIAVLFSVSAIFFLRESVTAWRRLRRDKRALALRRKYPDARYHFMTLSDLQMVLDKGIKGNKMANGRHIEVETPTNEFEVAEVTRLRTYAGMMSDHISALVMWADDHDAEINSVANI